MTALAHALSAPGTNLAKIKMTSLLSLFFLFVLLPILLDVCTFICFRLLMIYESRTSHVIYICLAISMFSCLASF